MDHVLSPKDKVILVVEDEPRNMKLIRDLLTFSGYIVIEASDGRQGIETAANEKPDLILMDIQMPVMDGLEATRILKSQESTKKIPVVALTAYAMREDKQRILATGCEGYISKPIDTRSFLETIKLFLLSVEKPETQAVSGADRPHKWKILLVDDDPKSLKLYDAILPGDKFEIITARSGYEALEKTAGEHPDAILLDIIMPDIDGLEVTRRIKKDPKTKNIPVILVTSLDDSETKEIGIESGAEEFLNKPVQAMELIARVNSMIRLKQYRDQLSIRSQSSEIIGNGPGIRARDNEKTDLPKELPLVLLVEDNETDIKSIGAALNGQPSRIEVVKTGKEALSYIQRHRVDLILLDILLPDMDGFEVLRRIKDVDEGKDIQVVVITCLGDIESKIKGIELGAEDFLVKPIIPRELNARVRVLLEKKGHLDKLRSHYENALDSAKIDWLTGLHNHGYFKQFLSLEIKRSSRQRYPVTLILIDVDNFKHYNDTLGHAAGDAFLKEISQIILARIREVDLAARYGGDEFAVVLPYAGKEDARHVAQRIHAAITSHNFLADPSRRLNRLTVSLGVAVFPNDAQTAEELIDAADQMLYKAKRNGKNQVYIFDPDLVTDHNVSAEK